MISLTHQLCMNRFHMSSHRRFPRERFITINACKGFVPCMYSHVISKVRPAPYLKSANATFVFLYIQMFPIHMCFKVNLLCKLTLTPPAHIRFTPSVSSKMNFKLREVFPNLTTKFAKIHFEM